MEKDTKPTQEELLKAVADVLDEALAEYERLTKSGQGIDNAETIDDMKGQGKGVVGEGEGKKPLMAKESEDKPEPVKEEDKKDKEDKDEDKEEDDEKLVETYKSLVAKMEERGLFQKAEVAKSDEDMDLRKSVDERFESLNKAIMSVSEAVKKISASPAAPRKGVTGVKPLMKTEDNKASVNKGEILGKLLTLKKSGDRNVDTTFINRIETGRLLKGDVERLKSLGIVSE